MWMSKHREVSWVSKVGFIKNNTLMGESLIRQTQEGVSFFYANNLNRNI
jgi:hypothetical protein